MCGEKKKKRKPVCMQTEGGGAWLGVRVNVSDRRRPVFGRPRDEPYYLEPGENGECTYMGIREGDAGKTGPQNSSSSTAVVLGAVAQEHST